MTETLKTFVVSYRHEGGEWSLLLKARDYDDAKARLGRLTWATIDGELMMTLPGYTGPLAMIIAATRNFLHRAGRP